MGERRSGWYQDPLDPSRERWWDGTRWGDDARPAAAEPVAPGPLPDTLTVVHDEPSSDAVGGHTAATDDLVAGASVGTASDDLVEAAATSSDGVAVREAGPLPPIEAEAVSRRRRWAWLATGAAALIVIVAIGMVLGSGGVDPAQPGGSVTVADDGLSASGTVGRDQRVALVLTVTEPGEVVIDVLGRAGFDPMLRLSQDGDVLDVNDDVNDDFGFDPGLQPQDSRIVRRLEPGTYLVEVAGFGGRGGSFDVRISAGELSIPLVENPSAP